MNKKTALITGITGQTGSYLAELLLDKGYEVHGMIRRSSTFNTERIDDIFDNLHLKYGDLADSSVIDDLVRDIKPNLLFNMGAMSHVRVSFDIPEYTMDISGTSVIRVLEAIRKYSPETHFIQASSSEIFGGAPPPQNEKTRFYPKSVYAIAKLAGYYATVNYREAYNIFASNAIMFNTESHRRGMTFVTQKICKGLANISFGLQNELILGNLDAKRDWNYCPSVCKALHLIATADKADDYCIGSGQTYSIKDFLDLVGEKLNLDWRKYVKFDAKYLRPTEVDVLQADASKIKEKLGWEPDYTIHTIIDEMVGSALGRARIDKIFMDDFK